MANYIRKIQLKPETSDKTFHELCNRMQDQGVFMASGSSGKQKWIVGHWEDEQDFLAWNLAMAGFELTSEQTEPTKQEPETPGHTEINHSVFPVVPVVKNKNK